MALKPTWKGNLKLGFVTQPVAIYAAKDSAAGPIRFNQIHAACGQRINEQTICRHCDPAGRPVDRSELLKGYEHSKGEYVLLTPDEVKGCDIDTTKVIDLQQFVPVSDVKPWMIAETHYVAPENPALAEAFALIVAALDDMAGIGTLAISNKEKLVAVVPNGRGLMLHTLRHADEVRDIDEIDAVAKLPTHLDSKTVALMRQLVLAMKAERLDLAAYPDTYKQKVQALINAKLAGGPTPPPSASTPKPAVSSLADLLKASLDAQPAGAESKNAAPRRKKVVAS